MITAIFFEIEPLGQKIMCETTQLPMNGFS
jgi:hypothetical protein